MLVDLVVFVGLRGRRRLHAKRTSPAAGVAAQWATLWGETRPPP